MAVRRTAAAGFQAMQLFTAKPQFYNDKIAIKQDRVDRFRAAIAETGLDPALCMAHAAYVLNTATPDMDKYERASLGLAKEAQRCTQLGIMGCCFHPGSAGDGDPWSAIDRIGDAIVRAIESAPGGARVLIENTAGGGRTMGRTPEEIAGMLDRVPATLRARTGYGLDTCHLFASGLDFTSSETALTALLDRFCEVTGEAPSFFHLNDSEGEFASNRDRHVLVGEGKIGERPFAWLLRDVRSHGIPLILETPHAESTRLDDDVTPDPNDVRTLELLRRLSAEG